MSPRKAATIIASLATVISTILLAFDPLPEDETDGTPPADGATAAAAEPRDSPATPSPEAPDDGTPAKQKVAATARYFDELLADQSRDADASEKAASHVNAVFERSETGGRLVDVDCSDSLCRTRLAFDDLAQRDASLRDVGSLMPWEVDDFFHRDPEDDGRVAIYFSRAGQSLPPVPGEQ